MNGLQSRVKLGTATVIALGMGTVVRAQAPCEGWLPGQGASISSGEFRTAVMYDWDGDGPAVPELIVGGSFAGLATVGGVNISMVARWDGVQWRGVLPTSMNGTISALTVYDPDGAGPLNPLLVMGGTISSPPTQGNVIAWNHTGLVTLGSGLTGGEVKVLATLDPDGPGPAPGSLYAVGSFTASGATQLRSGVARWTGSGWEQVGATGPGQGTAVTVIDFDGDGPGAPQLVMSTNAGSGVYALNASNQWAVVGAGLSGQVSALTVFDLDGTGPLPPRLMAAGNFNSSGSGTSLRGQAYFDGSAWRAIAPLSSSFTSTGSSLGVYDPDGSGPAPAELFLGGQLYLPNSNSQATRIAALRNGAWQAVTPLNATGTVLSMKQLPIPGRTDVPLLIEGTLTLGPATNASRRLSVWDGSTLAPFQTGFDASIYEMTPTNVLGRPGVAAMGVFTQASGVSLPGLGIFDGAAWTEVPTSPIDVATFQRMISFDPDGSGPAPEKLIVGGAFASIGGVAAQYIAGWDGQAWSALGTGFVTIPTAMTLWDADGPGGARPVLLVGGGPLSGGPGTPAPLMAWDGSTWTSFAPLITSANGPAMINGLASFDPDGPGPAPRQLMMVGFFTQIGNVQAHNVAIFDGVSWRATGTGVASNPQSISTWDRQGDGREVVVIGGGFSSVNGVTARGAAMWDGTSWSELGGGFGVSGSPAFQSYPIAFSAFDVDGPGPSGSTLYATGPFVSAGGQAAAGIARLVGPTWQAVGSGLDPAVGRALAVAPPVNGRPASLMVGGSFQSAGGTASAYFARYGITRCCVVDFNADGFVDSIDFFEYLNAFFASDPSAEVNSDGVLNSQDLFDFLSQFFAGC